jgi:hypothetical protein
LQKHKELVEELRDYYAKIYLLNNPGKFKERVKAAADFC